MAFRGMADEFSLLKSPESKTVLLVGAQSILHVKLY
jgi:hypothetical protein